MDEDYNYKRDAKAMEEYFMLADVNDPLRYKIMLFEYLPTLQMLNDKERIENCKKELASTYLDSMRKLDFWIDRSTEPYYKKNMLKLKREIQQELKKEEII